MKESVQVRPMVIRVARAIKMPRPQNQGKKPGAQNMQIPSQGQKQNQRTNSTKTCYKNKNQAALVTKLLCFFGVDIFEVLHQRQARLNNLL